MKTLTSIYFVISLIGTLACGVTVAQEKSDPAKEWSSSIEALLPVGERMAAQLVDPKDAQLRQELYRYEYSLISHAYFGLLYADPRHPDFWPVDNHAFNFAWPNPDDVYYVVPIDANGVYKVSGFRGTVRMVDFEISGGTMLTRGEGGLRGMGQAFANHDLDRDVHLRKDGSFEVVVSATQPQGYKGDWWKLDARATNIFVRQIAYDPLHEVDGRFAIERLDRPAIAPRASAAEIEANIKQIPTWVESWTQMAFDWMKRLRATGVVNEIHHLRLGNIGGIEEQHYVEGLFDINADEALILETEVPRQCRYWNFQLANELWSTPEYMHSQTSLNGHSARLDADGKLRIVISAKDPGVPNWMDNRGYQRGVVYGRWHTCSSYPLPTLKKIKVADAREYLPAATPSVSAEQRDAAIRLRRKGDQLRRRW